MSKVLSLLEEALDLSEPVSFREYCTSPDFCGDASIYERWLEDFSTTDIHTTEILIDGAIGSGKSFSAAYYFSYRVYLLFRNGDPCKRYSLKPGSPIYCIYFSTNMTSAKRGGYKYLQAAFKDCKWFKNNMPVDNSIESVIRFPSRNFEILAASSDSHAIGLNVWGFILDEANFKEGVGSGNEEEYQEVTRIYEQLEHRLASRFATPEGTEGLAMLISSASYQSSFTESRKELIKDRKNAKVFTAVTYEVKPWQFSKEKFEVFIGAGALEPCIIDSPEQKEQLLKDSGILGTGNEKFFFAYPPESIRTQFEENINLALQNHCGIPTNVKGRFMSNIRVLIKSYDPNLQTIFVSDDLVASTDDDTELIEYLVVDRIVHAERPHSLFLDLSVQGDAGALCCFRYDGIVDGLKRHTKVFSLHILPPKAPAQTRITKVCNLVVALSEYLNIVAFGSDQYQSTALRQEVQAELALEDIRVSIDSTDIPHGIWLRALTDGRITQYKEPKLEKEAREAVHDYKRHRVIKADKSSDDCFQANVGAFYLSDVVASSDADISDLYGPRLNLVGRNSMLKIQRLCGYNN